MGWNKLRRSSNNNNKRWKRTNNSTSIINIIIAVIIYRKVTGIIDVEGYASLLAIMIMGFGIIMLSIGILGEYLWRTFDAARNRPPFIIEKEENSDK